MSEDYTLRDEKGNPLGKVSDAHVSLLRLAELLYPEPFEIHEIDENTMRAYMRKKREEAEES